MSAEQESAITFQELHDELQALKDDLKNANGLWASATVYDAWYRLANLTTRINTEVLTAPKPEVWPSRTYWRYEFAGRMLQGILSNEACQQRLGQDAPRIAMRQSEKLLEALEEDEG